jgi:multisubunit Na+/H+ antiporter MnhE subunit
MSENRFRSPASLRRLLFRFGLLLGLWLVLTGPSLVNAAFGLPVALLAAVASGRLASPEAAGTSTPGLLRYAARLPRQSFLAGADVARYAFQISPAIRPGLEAGRTTLPKGFAREVFLTLASLQPGTLPVREGPGDAVLLHSINTSDPVCAEFARAETRFRKEVCPAAATSP